MALSMIVKPFLAEITGVGADEDKMLQNEIAMAVQPLQRLHSWL